MLETFHPNSGHEPEKMTDNIKSQEISSHHRTIQSSTPIRAKLTPKLKYPVA